MCIRDRSDYDFNYDDDRKEGDDNDDSDDDDDDSDDSNDDSTENSDYDEELKKFAAAFITLQRISFENEMSDETPMVETAQGNQQEISEHSIVNHDSQIEESLEKSQENKIENNEPLNGLENFAIEQETEEQTPELFNSDQEKDSSELLLSEENEVKGDEEDDLEIPAFLRRQKN